MVGEKLIDSKLFSRGLFYALRINGVESFERDRYMVNYALNAAKKKAGDLGIVLEDRLDKELFIDTGCDLLIIDYWGEEMRERLILSEEKSKEFFKRQLADYELEEFREIAREFILGFERYEKEFGHLSLR